LCFELRAKSVIGKDYTMIFKVLGGRHVDGVTGKTYHKDDIVESDVNLVEKFPNHFVRELALEAQRGAAPVQKGSPKNQNPTPPEDTGLDVGALGKDVTDEFEDAGPNGFLVLKKGRKYNVVDASKEEKVLITDEPITAKKVTALIDSYLEEDEDEEDED
jgi:hypothetical protein